MFIKCLAVHPMAKSLGETDKDFPYSIQQIADSGYIVAVQSISDDIDITGNLGQEVIGS